MLDKSYYYSVYGGTAVDGCDFARYEAKAANYVISRLRGSFTADTLPDSAKTAICAIIDIDAKYDKMLEAGGIKSQTVDGLSTTFRGSGDIFAMCAREKQEVLEGLLPADMLGIVQWI